MHNCSNNFEEIPKYIYNEIPKQSFCSVDCLCMLSYILFINLNLTFNKKLWNSFFQCFIMVISDRGGEEEIKMPDFFCQKIPTKKQ
jgi:hypothetical protein